MSLQLLIPADPPSRKAATGPKGAFLVIVLNLLFQFLHLSVQAQEQTETRPNQLDIIKVNIGQFFINSARFTYEHELAYDKSVEFGVGVIYPNNWWTYQGGSRFYGSGVEAQVGYRKYFDKRRYYFPTFFRSYLMPQVYYKYSAYEPQWVLYGDGLNIRDAFCLNESESFHQAGLRAIFGFQTRAGRTVLDLYGGLGLKSTWTQYTLHAENPPGEICGFEDYTTYPNETSRTNDFEVTVHLGVKVGIRLNNKERNYKERESKEEEFEVPAF